MMMMMMVVRFMMFMLLLYFIPALKVHQIRLDPVLDEVLSADVSLTVCYVLDGVIVRRELRVEKMMRSSGKGIPTWYNL